MAEESKIKLPKRLYYRLSEAAEFLGCTENDLIHWGATAQIELMAKMPRVKNVKSNHDGQMNDGVIYTTITFDYDGVELVCDFMSAEFVLLDSECLVDIELEGTTVIQEVEKFYYLNQGGVLVVSDFYDEFLRSAIGNIDNSKMTTKFELKSLSRIVGGQLNYEPLKDDYKLEVNLQDIFARAEEVDRIKHGGQLTMEQRNVLLTKKREQLDTEKPIHSRTYNTYIKTIAALKLELTKKYNVPENHIAKIIVRNSESIGESVAKSTVYDILNVAKKEQE